MKSTKLKFSAMQAKSIVQSLDNDCYRLKSEIEWRKKQHYDYFKLSEKLKEKEQIIGCFLAVYADRSIEQALLYVNI